MIDLNRVILLINIMFSMAKFRIIFTSLCFVLLGSYTTSAQVNTVEFGKNRVQYKKFKWQYYQTSNFNTYFNQNGDEYDHPDDIVMRLVDDMSLEPEHFLCRTPI